MSSIAVIGGGFSGISVCYHLVKKGFKPTLFDASLPEKASSVPLGLISPSSGQKTIPAWNYKEGLQASFHFLEELQNYSQLPIFDKNGVVRPAMNETMGALFKEKAPLFNGDLTFLEPPDFAKEFPQIYSEFGGLVIQEAGTVSGSRLHLAFSSFARKHEIVYIHDFVENIEFQKDEIRISVNKEFHSFDKVIICTGSVLPKMDFLDISALTYPVKGQITRLKVSNPDLFPIESISGMGYLARLKDEFVFGSTYEHYFTHNAPTEEGAQRLVNQLFELIPLAKENCTIGRQWSGIRASTPDRKPLLGSFDKFPNVHFYLGNGSKGMLWSVLLGDYVINHLIDEKPIPKEVDISRFRKKIAF